MYCKPNGRRYSKETLAMAVMWQSVSPACYWLIWLWYFLSSLCQTHQRLCSALTVDLELTDSAVAYLKARMSNWHQKISWVNLIMDEVHCLQTTQFYTGKFFGFENDEVTKSLLAVMIKFVCGSYRDIVCMTPIHQYTISIIRSFWRYGKMSCDVLRILRMLRKFVGYSIAFF